MPPPLFVAIYTAVYDYTPQSDDQLPLREGDILCIIEKPEDDDWWKAKKKGGSLDEDEPVGLVPSNYIEEAQPVGNYKALYDYTQQTEEEIDLKEDATLDVYDVSDPDWALVGYNGHYGFAPANYIEKVEGAVSEPAQETPPKIPSISLPAPSAAPRPISPEIPVSREPPRETHRDDLPPPQPKRPSQPSQPSQPSSAGQASPRSPELSSNHARQSSRQSTTRRARFSDTYTDSEDSDNGPSLPHRRPRGESGPVSRIPPGYRTWPVQEVDGRKKRAATLAVGHKNVILLPDKSTRPQEEWGIDLLTTFNYEGKHVFLEFQEPTRSLDLHAGATDTSVEIITALGELRGAHKATGLDEVIAAAAAGSKKTDIGTVLYDFPAQGEDEVSVTVGDEVIILDESNSEWWVVRRQVNGFEGVVPSSYIERGRKDVKQGIQASPAIRKPAEMGPSGIPDRTSSLHVQNRKSGSQKTKPDTSQVRTWTDRSGSFKVDAQFLGCRDGKIHLHKLNGVKIAVPVSKMSMADLQYVEQRTGMDLGEDKPLSEIMKEQRRKPQAGIVVNRPAARDSNSSTRSPNMASTGSGLKKEEYDWFDFFLGCGIDVNDCQRYATNFQRDNMDETILPDITPDIMRSLGLKAGDILRVSKVLEQRYGSKNAQNPEGGLFSKNKSTRTRPAPAIQTANTIDPNVFAPKEAPESPQAPTPISKSPQTAKPKEGFADNAWEVKPAKTQALAPQKPSPKPVEVESPATSPPPAMTGALGELASLSLSTVPLQPRVKTPPPISAPPAQPAQPVQQVQPVQPMQPIQPMQPMQQSYGMQDGLGFSQSAQPASLPSMNLPPSATVSSRTRPSAPTITNPAGLGIAPPPIARPSSVPSTFVSAPPALTAQYTGLPMNSSMNFGMGPQQPMVPMITGIGGGMQIPPQQTGFGYQSAGYPQQQVPPMPQFQSTMLPQQQMQPQPTGFLQPSFLNQPSSSAGGINSILPAPLVPQATAAPMPLRPQPTGPPPAVKFGTGPKKLTPQPTGRANLSKATPDNPFGF